mmetsp:Transcript_99059/g.302855  ORF Transcript_99059/g.302855 Transcript_99059/m.302855 type:complete len:231 (+) Transcript_99059:271-963(+)
MLSGLPARSSFSISTAFSLATMSAGTSSVETHTTEGLAAICIATSSANSLKIELIATKSVSLLTSTNTPIFLLKWMYEAIAPSADRFPTFLSALAMPFFFSHAIAFSMSPSLSAKAFLESRMPAPDRCLSSLTCAAETATCFFSSLGGSSFLGASSFGASALGSSGAAPGSDLYFASSFSTPAAKSSSRFSRPSPRVRRTKRRMMMFSPILAILSLRISATVLSSSLSHF